ncbi:CvpA family protein [Faecalispora anaeroviscerum]|uniref:CvpA family protein n=1 Tax=Faecalispora anaeroviscerum TaxID=2991836 RepID=UPI0024B89F1A|nr:CvpA family protein [Faecalispora anaeroviscerum]
MSLIDLILVAILTWFTIVGCEKGLIRSVAGFVGYVIASAAAAVIGRMAAGALFQNFIYDNLVGKITETLQKTAGQGAEQKAQALQDSLPSFLGSGLSGDGLLSTLNGSIEKAAPQIANLLSPSVIGFTRLVITVVLFSALYFVVRLLVRLLGSAFRLPILHQIDMAAGGVVGFFSGCAIVLLLCMLLQIGLPMMKGGLFGITQSDLKSSWVYQSIYEKSPVNFLFPEE